MEVNKETLEILLDAIVLEKDDSHLDMLALSVGSSYFDKQETYWEGKRFLVNLLAKICEELEIKRIDSF